MISKTRDKNVWLALTFLATLALVPASSAQTYTITVHTDSQSYTGAQSLTISGAVSPAPGLGTGVFVQVFSPESHEVMAGEADVNGTSGGYAFNGVTGGTSNWTPGTYTVNATWGAYGSSIFATTTFTWSPATRTTSSSTSSTSTTITVGSSTSTTSSTSSSTSPSASTTSPATTHTSVSTSTSSSKSSSGGIPEFPYQSFLVVTMTVIVAAAYLLARHRMQNTQTDISHVSGLPVQPRAMI